MPNRPKVTVAIPVFNGRANLDRALKAALRQTYPHVEILIVDDGSTDGTDTLVRQYSDRRLRLVQHESNVGVAAARNTAILAAEGDLLAWLDSDDWSVPERVEHQVRLLTQSRDRVMTCCWARTLSGLPRKGAAETAEDDWVLTTNRPALRSRHLAPALLFGNPVAMSSLMMKLAPVREREIFFDPSLKVAEDYAFMISLSEVGTFHLQPKTLVHRWELSTGLSANNHQRLLLLTQALRLKVLSDIGLIPTATTLGGLEVLGGATLNVHIHPDQFIQAADAVRHVRSANLVTQRFPTHALDEVLFSRLARLVPKVGLRKSTPKLLFSGWARSTLPATALSWTLSQLMDEMHAIPLARNEETRWV